MRFPPTAGILRRKDYPKTTVMQPPGPSRPLAPPALRGPRGLGDAPLSPSPVSFAIAKLAARADTASRKAI